MRVIIRFSIYTFICLFLYSCISDEPVVEGEFAESTEPSFVLNNSKSHLYIAKNDKIQIVNIESISDLKDEGSLITENSVKHLNVFDSFLVVQQIGKTQIYNINQATNPISRFTLNQVNECNPLIIKDNVMVYAKSHQNQCGDSEALLNGISLDIQNTAEIFSYENAVVNPKRIISHENIILVAENDGGLKLFDATFINSYMIYKSNSNIKANEIKIDPNNRIYLITDLSMLMLEYNDEGTVFTKNEYIF